MDTHKSKALLVAAICIVAAAVILYLFFTGMLSFPSNVNANVFSENGVYFQYPKNWTVVNSFYNATSSGTIFHSTIVPDSLIGSLVYDNGSFIQDSNISSFSEIGIVIMKNTDLNKMYDMFIFNASYVHNGTDFAGYTGSEGITHISASSLNPESESITYVSYGGGFGYSVGAFFTPSFNSSTISLLGLLSKTLKYKG